MKHREKLRLARRMMTQDEISQHIPPFESQAWLVRKKAILEKQLKGGEKMNPTDTTNEPVVETPTTEVPAEPVAETPEVAPEAEASVETPVEETPSTEAPAA